MKALEKTIYNTYKLLVYNVIFLDDIRFSSVSEYSDSSVRSMIAFDGKEHG